MNKNEIIEVAVQKLKSLTSPGNEIVLSEVFDAGVQSASISDDLKQSIINIGRVAERERILEILKRRQIGIVANLPVSVHTNSAYLREEFRMMWQHMINEIEAITHDK